jgi:hypothetical protein
MIRWIHIDPEAMMVVGVEAVDRNTAPAGGLNLGLGPDHRGTTVGTEIAIGMIEIAMGTTETGESGVPLLIAVGLTAISGARWMSDSITILLDF